MAQSDSDYHRGQMNIAEQRSTFHLVMGLTKWGSLIIAVTVLFFTLWMCTAAGFMGAAFTAIVVTAIGVMLLRDKGGHAADQVESH
ncbi:MAG TPA: aa3-type cytochrome c oxidase subunit IV [Phenylobacterium sp.]